MFMPGHADSTGNMPDMSPGSQCGDTQMEGKFIDLGGFLHGDPTGELMYVYVSNNPKSVENEMIVSFSFPPNTTSVEAINCIDKLVRLADNDVEYTFTSHNPEIYEVVQRHNRYIDMGDDIETETNSNKSSYT